MLRFSGVGLSHRGLVREGNEDSGFVGPSCVLVADGVGGAAAGEVASATAAYVVSAMSLADPAADPATLLRAGLDLAEQQLALGVRRDPARAGMATTLTAVATDGVRCALAHVGDSRGYVFRDGTLTRVTRDDTVVARLVDEGRLDEADVPFHPWRNVVLRSLGGGGRGTGEVAGEGVGEVSELALRPGDRVLLASDGLTDLVSELRIEHVLAAHHDDAAVEVLVDAALEAGGRDNVTCLLATVVESTPVSASVSLQGLLVGAVRDPRLVVDAGAVRRGAGPIQAFRW